MDKKKRRFPAKWIWCLGLIGLGMVVIAFCPGYDFSGLFLMGLGSLIPLYHCIGLLIPKHRALGKGLHLMLTGFLIFFFGLMAVTGFTIYRTSQGTENPDSPYLVVLGAGVNGSTPSRSLRERLDAAYDYLNGHPEAVAIVSGGQGSGEDISEAQCMYDFLTAKGIAPERVWMESEATSTLENLKFSLKLIEEKTGAKPGNIAIVSSEYHLHRAGIFAGWLDVEAELVPAKTGIVPLRWNYYFREVLGVWYYTLFGGL